MHLSIPFVVMRIALVGFGGPSVFNSGFLPMCNTHQPGCDRACFNKPLLPLQFWNIQIILITTPLIWFMALAKWKENSQEHITSKDAVDEAEKEVVEKPSKKQDGLVKAYLFQLLSRAIFEASFLFGQYLLYGVEVKGSFHCSHEPCPHTVDCYVPYPKMKTVFLLIMYAVNGLCLIFTVLEILLLAPRKICCDSCHPPAFPSSSWGKERQRRCCNPALQNFDLVYENDLAEARGKTYAKMSQL